ncbi:hypothetical protein, partial [Bacillus subtilis]|uniref:hypothetical protein n=1 Tax=Bacillus subtilis TaxID=1423 RepID=UPI003C19AFA7
ETIVAAPARVARIVAKTADYTLIASDSGTIFTNQGAAGAVNFTLPALASIDAAFRAEFFCEAGQTITV